LERCNVLLKGKEVVVAVDVVHFTVVSGEVSGVGKPNFMSVDTAEVKVTSWLVRSVSRLEHPLDRYH
jgi:hypothetical protein